MRAAPKEAEAAREEGARLVFHHRPLEILGHDGGVSGVRFASCEGEQTLHCDAVILAFGFVPAPPAWLARFNVVTDADGRIIIDELGRTTNPRIYAGGDNTHGPDLVVTALASGRAAAETILKDLSLKGRVRRKLFRKARLPSPQPAAVTAGAAGGLS